MGGQAHRAANATEVAAAAAVAARADVVVLVLGESTHTCGEWADRPIWIFPAGSWTC